MRAFAELLDRLSLTASRNAKLTLVRDYLRAHPHAAAEYAAGKRAAFAAGARLYSTYSRRKQPEVERLIAAARTWRARGAEG